MGSRMPFVQVVLLICLAQYMSMSAGYYVEYGKIDQEFKREAWDKSEALEMNTIEAGRAKLGWSPVSIKDPTRNGLATIKFPTSAARPILGAKGNNYELQSNWKDCSYTCYVYRENMYCCPVSNGDDKYSGSNLVEFGARNNGRSETLEKVPKGEPWNIKSENGPEFVF